MNLNKAEKDFEIWYEDHEDFRKTQLQNYIIDNDSLLFEGREISPELKKYSIEFAATNPDNPDNYICTFGSLAWQVECRICDLSDEKFDVAVGCSRTSTKIAFKQALHNLEKYLKKSRKEKDND
jgi:hypothetical protein